MIDARIERWAHVIISYSLSAKPGDKVAIVGGVDAEPLLRAIGQETLTAGAHPVIIPTLRGPQADLLTYGSDEQLSYISPIETFARLEADCLAIVAADSNTRSLAEIDPARQRFHRSARAELG